MWDLTGMRYIKDIEMSLHQVEYGYMLPEWSTVSLEIDETLDVTEKEAIALAEIKAYNPDIFDIEVLSMKVIE